MINILYVHQSADLYGSDKVLLNLVERLDRNIYYPIVLVPEWGPLINKLREHDVEAHVGPVFKITRKMYHARALFNFPAIAWRSTKAIDKVVQQREIRLVHSNTVAVLGGALWSKMHNVPHLWHVHELIVSPTLARKGFPILLRIFADHVICVSNATKTWIVKEQKTLQARTHVIWDGVPPNSSPSQHSIAQLRQILRGEHPITMVTLVGRINRWKGHWTLIDAAEILWHQGYRNVHFALVGSAPKGQEDLRKDLIRRINSTPVKDNIKLLGFVGEIDAIWELTDIAVVPSIEPEPFGMVAIEAMAAGKPVVAAAHGGLLDIVVHEKTGLLFNPGDAVSLSNALLRLLDDNAKQKAMGQAGKKRQNEIFTVDTQVNEFSKFYAAIGYRSSQKKCEF